MFHPLIHPDTGLLDLTPQFPVWRANQHYLVLLLAYIKRIFYNTSMWETRPSTSTSPSSSSSCDVMNPKAHSLWSKNREEYIKLAEKNALKSQSNEKLYANHEDEKMTIKFEKPKAAHEEAHRRIVADELRQVRRDTRRRKECGGEHSEQANRACSL